MESLYEYGSRSGFWRLYRLMTELKIPITVFGVGMALERNPSAVAAMKEADWEIASHAYRWIDHQHMSEDEERSKYNWPLKSIKRLLAKLRGWYTGRDSPNTRKLVIDHGGFLYDSDSYADDLPYWHHEGRQSAPSSYPTLWTPTTCDLPPIRVLTQRPIFTYLKDAFDELYDEGQENPKMLSVGLHCRLAGRPGRARSLRRFLEYVLQHEDVWLCRRIDIAKHWYKHHKTGPA